MLDKRFILENVELVQTNSDNRGVKVDVSRFAELETERRKLQTEVEELNRQANQVSKSIGQAADDAERQQRKDEGRRLREQKDAVALRISHLDVDADSLHRKIPNLSHADAPVGDEASSRKLRDGATEVRPLGFVPLDHVELAEKHDLIDFDAGARVAGGGFYFLKNEAALLELALRNMPSRSWLPKTSRR